MPLTPMSHPLLIFDWDGTLVDSIGRIVDCFEKTYALLNLVTPPLPKIRQTIGLPLKEGFRQLEVGLESPGLTVLAETYRDIWLDPQLAPSPLFPGVRTLLTHLRDAGHILAVATGKSRVGLDRESRAHKVDHLFATSVCGDETHPKPSPDMLLEILRKTGITPAQALLFGDSPLDLAMANNAQIQAVGVLTGAGDRSSLAAYHPLTFLDHVGQLRKLLLT